MRKDNLSNLTDGAAKWRVLDQTMSEARTAFADLSPEAVEDLVDKAATAARRSPLNAMAPKAP